MTQQPPDDYSWDPNAPGADPGYGWEEPPLPERSGPAWERRRELGFFSAFFKTIGQCLLHPESTFSDMRREGGLGGPMLFSVLSLWLFNLFALVINEPFAQLTESMLPPEMTQQSGAELGFAVEFFAYMIIAPILIPIGLLINAGVTHVFLMIFGAARHGFETTFRVVAYVAGAVAVLYLIPICGGLLSPIVQLVIIIIALIRTHETDAWRVLCAVLVPFFLMVACCIGAILIFGVSLALLLDPAQMQEVMGNLQ